MNEHIRRAPGVPLNGPCFKLNLQPGFAAERRKLVPEVVVAGGDTQRGTGKGMVSQAVHGSTTTWASASGLAVKRQLKTTNWRQA